PSQRRIGRLARLDSAVSQLSPSAGDGEAAVVEQLFHAHQRLDVATRIDSLPARRFLGPDRAKLGFPVTKNVRFDADRARHFTDAKVELGRQDTHVAAISSAAAVADAGNAALRFRARAA